jgi:ectoine hydroxylase-related dioxygenase (phytanoyl-CoA dioxygenase family)
MLARNPIATPSIAPIVSDTHIRELRDDGITCLRGVFDEDAVERFRRSVERAVSGEHETVMDYGSGRKFVNGMFLWTWDQDLQDLICRSHLPALAARLMESRKANLFFDQLFVKEPGSADYPTPWHHDQPYWPVKGSQVISIWIALDPVTRESGAVQYIRGSHRWNRRFQPQSFSGPNRYAMNPDFEPAANIRPERYDDAIASFELAPGDATVHHGLTLHAAGGNRSSRTRRRGYSIRFTGDDVTYDPQPWTFPLLRDPDIAPGAPMDCSLFPVLYED